MSTTDECKNKRCSIGPAHYHDDDGGLWCVMYVDGFRISKYVKDGRQYLTHPNDIHYSDYDDNGKLKLRGKTKYCAVIDDISFFDTNRKQENRSDINEHSKRRQA